MRLVKELLLAGSLTMAACAERQTTVEMAETRETIKEKLLAEVGVNMEDLRKNE